MTNAEYKLYRDFKEHKITYNEYYRKSKKLKEQIKMKESLKTLNELQIAKIESYYLNSIFSNYLEYDPKDNVFKGTVYDYYSNGKSAHKLTIKALYNNFKVRPNEDIIDILNSIETIDNFNKIINE